MREPVTQQAQSPNDDSDEEDEGERSRMLEIAGILSRNKSRRKPPEPPKHLQTGEFLPLLPIEVEEASPIRERTVR